MAKDSSLQEGTMRESRKHEIGYMIAKFQFKQKGISIEKEVVEDFSKKLGILSEEVVEFMEIVDHELFNEKYPSKKNVA